MSREPVNVKHTSIHHDPALAYSLLLWVFPGAPSVFCSAYNYIQHNARSSFCHFVIYICGHLALAQTKSLVYYFTIDLMKEKHSNAQTCMGSSVSFQMGAFSVDFVAAFIITPMYSAFSLRVRRFHR